MRQSASAPRRFLSSTGGVVDLDSLLAEQQHRRVQLEDDLRRTKARVTHVEQRLQGLPPGEPHKYATLSGAQVDLDQDLLDAKAHRRRLEVELSHLDGQLQETRRRIEAYDRDRRAHSG